MKIIAKILMGAFLALYTISSFANVPLVRGWPINDVTMGNITNASSLGLEIQHLADRVIKWPNTINTFSVFTYSGQGGSETWNLEYFDKNIKDPKVGKLYSDALPALKNKTLMSVIPVVVIYTCGASNSTDAIGWDVGIHTNPDAHKDLNDNNIKKWLYNLILTAEQMEEAYKKDNSVRGTILLNPDFLGELHKIANGSDWAPFDYKAPNILLKTKLDELKQNKPEIRLPENYPAFVTNHGTFADYIQTINWLMKIYAPDIAFGWMDNIWAGDPSGHKWIHHPEQLQQHIDDEATFLNSLGIFQGPYKPDFIAFDKYERDNFGIDDNALNNGYTYNVPAWNTYFDFIAGVDRKLGNIPVMLFQFPGGHIQTTNDVDSRDSHGSTSPDYLLGNPSLQIKLSNAKKYIFDSVFVNAQRDYNFSGGNKVVDYLNNGLDEAGWGQGHLAKLVAANVFAILWGGGNTTGLAGLSADTDDNGWLADVINKYYHCLLDRRPY